MQIKYSERFRTGKIKEKFWQDFPQMSTQDISLLDDFSHAVENSNPICGKQRPSWEDDNGLDYKNDGAKFYKKYQIWHCHIGVFSEDELCKKISLSKSSHKAYCFVFKKNIDGRRSAGIVHYMYKADTDEVVILAFSPEHTPFPFGNSKTNPIRTRLSGIIIIDGKLIFLKDFK